MPKRTPKPKSTHRLAAELSDKLAALDRQKTEALIAVERKWDLKMAEVLGAATDEVRRDYEKLIAKPVDGEGV